MTNLTDQNRPRHAAPLGRRRAIRWGIVATGLALFTWWASAALPGVLSRWGFARLEADWGVVGRADQIALDPLALRLRARGVSLAAVGAEDEPFLAVEAVSIDLPWSVVLGARVVDAVEIVAPVLLARVGGDETSNLPRLPSAPSVPGPPEAAGEPWRLRALSVERAALSWLDEPSGAAVRVDSVDLRLQPQAGGEESAGRLTVSTPTRLMWGEQETVLEPFAAGVTLRPHTIGVQDVLISAPEGSLAVSGEVEFGGSGALSVDYGLDLDLASLSTWLESATDLTGAVRLAGLVDGSVAMPSVSARLESAAVGWRGLGIRDVDVTARVADGRLTVEDLRAAVAGGTVQGTGSVAPADDADETSGEAQLSWTDVSLDLLAAAVAPGEPAPFTTAVSGAAEVAWSGHQPSGLSLSMESRHTAPRGGRLPIEGRWRFDAGDAGWRLDVERLSARAIELSGSLSGATPGAWTEMSTVPVSGVLGGRVTDLRRFVADLELTGVAADIDPTGAAAVDLTISGSLAALALAGDLTATGAVRDGQDPFELRAGILASEGVWRADDVDLAVGSSSLLATAALNGDVLTGRFGLRIPSLVELWPLLPGDWRPAGALEVDGTLGGTRSDPIVRASLAATDLAVAGQHVLALEGEVQAGRDAILVESLVLRQETGGLNASGRFEPATGQYLLAVEGNGVRLAPVSIGDADPVPVQATVDLAWDGAGSLDAPRGDGRVVLRDLVYDDMQLDRLENDLTLGDGVWRLLSVAPTYSATSELTIQPGPPWRYQVEVALDNADLARLAGAASGAVDIAGTATAALRVDGVATDLEASTASLTIVGVEARIADTPVRLMTPARVEAQASGLRVDEPFDVHIGASQMNVSGGLLRNGGLTLTTTMTGDLSDLDGLLDETDERAGGPVQTMAGPFRMDVRVTGSIERPTVAASLSIDDGALTVQDVAPLTDVTLRAAYDAAGLTLSRLEGHWQDAALSAEAEIPASMLAPFLPSWLGAEITATGGPARLRAAVEGLGPAAVADWVDPSTLEELTGEVGFEVALEADRLELSAVRGTLTVGTLDLRAAGLPVTQQQPTRLTLADDRLTVDRFAWQIGATTNTVTLGGHVDLLPEPTADLTVTGTADLSVLNAFSRTAVGAGNAYLVANVGGTIGEPSIDGVIELSDGDLRVVEPRLLVSDLNGALVFQGTTMRAVEFTGTANGGPLRLDGEVRFPGLRPEGALTLTGREIALVVSPGLRTELDTDLVLTLAPDDITISGTVEVVRGDYREPVNTAGGLRALLESPDEVFESEEPSVLDDVRLNVRVTTRDDIVVSNNYAAASVAADTRLVGTLARPGVTGRLTVSDGGRLYLGGNEFEVESGTIDLVDPDALTPQLDVTARTRIGAEEITITLEGTADTLTTTMRSSNELPESDIVSLLLTGRTLEQVGRAPGAVARDRALGLVSGEILGAAGRTVGLDTVRLDQGSTEGDVRFDPSLVAGDTNPGTRLTVGKNLSRQVELVASQNLRESGLFTWIVNYLPRRNIELRLVIDDETDRSYEFRHALTFGDPRADGGATRPRRIEPRVSSVRFSGDAVLTEPELQRLVRMKAGDRFDFLRWQDGRERIERALWERDHQEAIVRARRTPGTDTDTVGLEYEVGAGPRTVLEMRGYAPPARLWRQMEAAWRASVFDAFLLDELTQLTRRHLVTEGFLRASVSARVDGETELEKKVTVDVETGPQFSTRLIRFTGQQRMPTERLERLVTTDRGADAWAGGDDLLESVRRAYRAEGWLETQAELQMPVFTDGIAILTVAIQEGPQFHLSAVEVDGAREWTVDQVRAAAQVGVGDVYRSGLAENTRATLLAAYRAAGFSDVRVRTGATIDPVAATVALTISVRESRRQLLRRVEVVGAPRTHPPLVERALRLNPGDPVDPVAWNQARKRLYDTGVFRSVDITAEPIADAEGTPGTGPDQPVVARVTLEEWSRYRLRYGLQVIDEQAPAGEADARGQLGVVADLTRQNLFGRGITVGTSARYDTVQQAGRGFLVFPSFLGRAITSNLFLSQLRETFGPSGAKTISQRRRLTLEQRLTPRGGVTFSYSYNFERNRTFDENLDPTNPFAFDLTVDVARLTGGVVVERRNDLFDATSGWFHASTLEWGVERLGSDLRFLKYLGQVFYFRPLPYGIVLASAGRVGLGRGFGQQLIPSERFFAGGGTTVRGYLQDALGPVDFFGDASGGAASLVFNQEVRFPLFAMFRGVGFVDAGNVFDSIRSVSLRDLKVGVGLGLRTETPVGLIRVDYGSPLSRAAEEPLGRWFFSIGQAF